MEKYRDNDPGKGQTAYDRLSDEALLPQHRAGDAAIMDYVLDKYKPLVRKKANAMFLIGGDTDDLIQEGMIGLFKAVQDYDPKEGASFSSFAGLCVSRQMYTAIKASQRKKHAPLNSYVSLDEEPDNDGQIPLTEVLQSLTNGNPEDMVIDQENVEAFQKKIEKCLSKMEKEVLALTLQGLDYHQVAQIMDKSPKSIDNALQRIRAKIREILERV